MDVYETILAGIGVLSILLFVFLLGVWRGAFVANGKWIKKEKRGELMLEYKHIPAICDCRHPYGLHAAEGCIGDRQPVPVDADKKLRVNPDGKGFAIPRFVVKTCGCRHYTGPPPMLFT